jgi:hypothetical protein
MATPRQLSRNHKISILLEPHLRFTLRANHYAYKYFTNRKKTYAGFYAGTLEEMRQIAIQSYRETDFLDLEFETDLVRRGANRSPSSGCAGRCNGPGGTFACGPGGAPIAKSRSARSKDSRSRAAPDLEAPMPRCRGRPR